jgi:inosine-uridine nucleoside N-ribohydrolase
VKLFPTLLLLACLLNTSIRAEEIPDVIFDTDIAGDVDDVLALAMLHTLADRHELRIAAVTVSKSHPLNAPMVDAINTFYGRANLPIGVTKGEYPRDSKYLELVRMKDGGEFRYPHKLMHSNDAPDAVQVMRQILAAAKQQSITIIQVGLAVNVADLLESPADKISPLKGTELVREKVKLLSIMAGAFNPVQGNTHYLEANVRNQVSSMQRLVNEWPEAVPVIWSDFNIGIAAPYPRESIARDFRYREHHLVRESYLLHSGAHHDRPTWDLTSVLVVARENDNYFHYSDPGTVEVDDDGFTRFLPTEAGNATGNHRYLTMTPSQAIRVIEVQRALVSQPPLRNLAP